MGAILARAIEFVSAQNILKRRCTIHNFRGLHDLEPNRNHRRNALDIVDDVVEDKDEANRLKFQIQRQLIETKSSELEAQAKKES